MDEPITITITKEQALLVYRLLEPNAAVRWPNSLNY
jgi:hypothetical protein